MKKIILTLFLICTLVFSTKVYAKDVIPQYVSKVKTNTVGLYQASNQIVLHEQPDEKSNIVQKIEFQGETIYPEEITAEELFVVFQPNKNLALMAVLDEIDGWVEVIYENSTGKSAWLKQDDPYKFSTWIYFYNTFGRKYGLKLLRTAPDEAKNLHAGTQDLSQITGTINMAEKINLTAIKGNWALVSVYDLDKIPKTGYVKWRSDDGIKYFFPDLK
ncbi:MAG: hypothetical protein R3Y28_08540 [Candidatus Gastranaerophilales bacterium]